MPKLLQHREKVEVAPSFQNRRAIDIFRDMSFSVAEHGMLVEVARYLRGSTNLRIPADWRAVLPTEL